jgi:hypothetical protein
MKTAYWSIQLTQEQLQDLLKAINQKEKHTQIDIEAQGEKIIRFAVNGRLIYLDAPY